MSCTLIILGCTARPKSPGCIGRAEYIGQLSDITEAIKRDGWKVTDWIKGNAICPACVKREANEHESQGQ